MKEHYYIRNEGYLGNAFIWWKPEHKGYTSDIRKAGKYTLEEVTNICKRPEDTAFSCEYIDSLEEAKQLVIDSQYVDRKKELFKNQ